MALGIVVVQRAQRKLFEIVLAFRATSGFPR
jgi:hypothetical protein